MYAEEESERHIVHICIKTDDWDDEDYYGEAGGNEEAPKTYKSLEHEGYAEVDYDYLISYPWFEAKLSRWNEATDSYHDEEEDPWANPDCDITIYIPKGGHATTGARLLQYRVAAEETTVEPPLWWDMAVQNTETLVGALCIFHQTMLEEFAREVAATLSLYRVACPQAVVRIGEELGIPLRADKEPVDPIAMKLSGVEQLVKDASMGGNEHVKTLAERALAGTTNASEVVTMLVRAFFSLMDLEAPTIFFDLDRPDILEALELGQIRTQAEREMHWLTLLLEDLIRNRPKASLDIISEIRNYCRQIKLEFYVVFRKDGQNTKDPPETRPAIFHENGVEAILNLLKACVNIVLLMSCSPKCDESTIMPVLRALVNRPTWQEFGVLQETISARCPAFDPMIFYVAPLNVQQNILQMLTPPAACNIFRGNTKLVHEELRHYFLDMTASLDNEDVAFLATAKFPGLAKEKPSGQAAEHWPSDNAGKFKRGWHARNKNS